MQQKKKDTFGTFTDWLWQEFDLPVVSLGAKRKVELKGEYHANLSVISKPKNVCLSTETKLIV